jgi:hypothetical protein
MGKYEEINNLSPANFRRLTGIKRETFEKGGSHISECSK